MTLEGTLDAFGVGDVLEMLAGAAKTGRLRVDGDGGRATVQMRDGAVISAASDRASGSPLDEVICDLLRYEHGSFAFEADDGAAAGDSGGNGRSGRAGRSGRDGRHGHEAVPELLARAGSLLAERRALEAVVPSFDHRVGLTERLADGDHVTIDAEQWNVLVAVGAGCTVGELAATLGLSELSAMRTVHDLVTAGLTTVRAAAEPRAGWLARDDADPPRPSRSGRSTRPGRPSRPAREAVDTEGARDAHDARDIQSARDARIARYEGHAAEDPDAGPVGDRRGSRGPLDASHDRHDGHDRHEGEVWPAGDAWPGDDEAWPADEARDTGDGRPWRPPEPGHGGERERYWPDPPPLGSRG